MSHKTLVGGTDRSITGGRCMVGGTPYSIKGGRTLVGGTSYAISFGPSVVTVTITSNGVANTALYAIVAGTRYTTAAEGLEVMPGDQMTFGYGSTFGLGGYGTGTLKIDGVTIGTLVGGQSGTYVWTVPQGISAVTIALTGMPNFGSIEVTTS